MKASQFKDYSELPLFLNAETVAKVLDVSPSSGYELMHESGFPVLKIGSRMVVPKEKFIQWVEQNTVGGTQLRGGTQHQSAGLAVIRGTTDSPCPTRCGSTSSSRLSL